MRMTPDYLSLAGNDGIIARMDNRAYTFAFLAILLIVCLGAYVAVSALVDSSSDPLIKLGAEAGTPTLVSLSTRSATSVPGTRTPTPTNTPFVLVIPTIIFPTVTPTPLPPTRTPTLPPFPSPRPLPTRTPTPTPTEAAAATPVGPTATSAPTNTPTVNPGSFPFRVESGPSVDRTRNCASQYIIFGYVRDGQGQGLPNVPIRFVARYPRPQEFQGRTKTGSEAGRYELTVGTSDNEFDLTIVDNDNRPQSVTIKVITAGFDSGNCWYQLNWRRN